MTQRSGVYKAPQHGNSVYRFRGFSMDLEMFELRDAAGDRVDIARRAFDLLAYLLLHRTRVVSREELLDAVWPDVTVGDNSLSQCVWTARQAVQDTGHEQCVIEGVRGRGYRFVAQVDALPDAHPRGEAESQPTAADATPAGPPEAGARRVILAAPGLVGRGTERARLHDALEDARRGRPRLCLLTGDAGMGKTTLLEALAVEAAHQGARVLAARSLEGQGAPPFWPWQQLIRECVRQLSEQQRAALRDGEYEELAQLMPELTGGTSRPAAFTGRTPDEQRFRLFEQVTRFVREVASDRLVLLTLDDLHWADAPSMRLLAHMAAHPARCQLLICAAYRDHEATPELIEAAAAVLRNPGAELVELPGLGSEDVCELLALHGAANPTGAVLERVAALTAGNPLFVQHVARDLARGTDVEGLKLPQEAVAVVAKRVAALPARCVELLRVASVLGPEFHVNDLRRTVATEGAELVELLEEAVGGGVITLKAGCVADYRFAHPTLREAVYVGMPQIVRAQWHERIGDRIADDRPAEARARLSEIALHYYHAASAGAAERAVKFARLAADEALRATAFEDAVDHYRRALEVFDLIEAAPERERCELLLGLAHALRSVPAPLDETRAAYAEVARRARALDAPDLLVEAALGYAGRGRQRRLSIYREAGTVDHGEVQLLEEALASLEPGETPQRALVAGWLAWSLYNTAQVQRRLALADESVAIARRIGDPALLAETLGVHQHAIHGPARLDARIEALCEIVDLLADQPPTGLLHDAHAVRAWALLERGDIAGAEADIAKAARVASELRQPSHWAWAFRVMHAHVDARFEEVDALHAQWQSGQPSQHDREDQTAAIRLFVTRYLRGRAQENVTPLQQLAERFPLPVGWNCGLLSALAVLGRHRDAQRELDRLRATGFTSVPIDHNWMSSMNLLAGAAAELNDQASADLLRGLLSPYSGRVVVVGIAGVPLGPVDTSLGRLHNCLERYDDAARHYERGLQTCRNVGMPVWLAFTELSYAQSLLRRGERRDRARAERLLQSASAYIEGKDLGQLLSMAAEVADGLRRSGARAVPSGRRSQR